MNEKIRVVGSRRPVSYYRMKHSHVDCAPMMYFILDERTCPRCKYVEKFVKVGTTKRIIQEREGEFQQGNPNLLKILGTVNIADLAKVKMFEGIPIEKLRTYENKIKEKYEKYLVKEEGEWYRYEGALENFIEKLLK